MRWSHDKRFDEINDLEIDLTPRQWAIMLADEIRRHASELEFFQAVSKTECRRWPFVKPYFALGKQAAKSHPGGRLEDGRAQHELSAKLRKEFHALHQLINIANREAKARSEAAGLRVRSLIDRLSHVLLRDAVATMINATNAWAEGLNTAGAGEGECEFVPKGLGQLKIAAGSRRSELFQARDWADDAAALLMELHACQTTVELLQETYFGRHEILAPDVEAKLQSRTQVFLEAIANFDAYLTTKIKTFGDNSPQPASQEDESLPRLSRARAKERWSSLRIDVEVLRNRANEFARMTMVHDWKREATLNASLQTLQETDDHDEFFESQFREAVRARTEGRSSAG